MSSIFDTYGNTPMPPDAADRRDDRYRFGARNHNYPKGQFTRMLDGRLIRDCRFNTYWGYRITPNAVVGLANTPITTVPRDRVHYIERIISVSPTGANLNFDCRWQLWIDNKFIYGGVCMVQAAEVKIYIPPYSTWTVYFRFANNTGAPTHDLWNVQYVEFDASRDTWKWGEGSRHRNPAAGVIVWP